MKPIHWIILAILLIAVIAFFVYQHQKKKKIQTPKKQNAEGWLLHNYKILVNKGGLKKADNFSDAMNNFDDSVKKVESLSSDELSALGYDRNAIGWLRNIWRSYSVGNHATMEAGIKAEAEAAA
jgi:hypothetical protein